VVLTDAVYLSMNKSEAPTEVVGEVSLRGGGRVRLRRRPAWHRSPPPRTAAGAGAAPATSGSGAAVRLRVLAESASRSRASARCGRGRAAAGGGRPPASNVTRGADSDALARAKALLKRTSRSRRSSSSTAGRSAARQDPEVQVVRGKAEHALGQLGPAFADFRRRRPAGSRRDRRRGRRRTRRSAPIGGVFTPLAARSGEGARGQPGPEGRARGAPAPPLLAGHHPRRRAARAGARRRGHRRRPPGGRPADLLDARASCAARKSAVRRLALVPGGERRRCWPGRGGGKGLRSGRGPRCVRRRQSTRIAQAR